MKMLYCIADGHASQLSGGEEIDFDALSKEFGECLDLLCGIDLCLTSGSNEVISCTCYHKANEAARAYSLLFNIHRCFI